MLNHDMILEEKPMKKRIKTIIESIIVCGVIAAVAVGITLNKNDCSAGYTWAEDPNRLIFPETRTNLTLIVNYDNGTTEEYKEIDLDDHYTTVFDLVNKCCWVEYDLYCQDVPTFFITTINDIGEGWIYKINDYLVPAGCNTISPTDDSIIYWEFVGPDSEV
jgi:hypothetical protein